MAPHRRLLSWYREVRATGSSREFLRFTTVVLAAILLFVVISSFFPRPGIYYDSVLRAATVVPLIEPEVEPPYDYPLSVRIFGTEIPLVLREYIGNNKSHYYLPFKLFGISTEVWHLYNDFALYFALFLLCIALRNVYGSAMSLTFLFLSLPDESVNTHKILPVLDLLPAIALSLYLVLLKHRAHPKFFVFPFIALAFLGFNGVKESFILPAYFLHQLFYLVYRKDLSLKIRTACYLCFLLLTLLFISPLVYYNLTKGDLLQKLYYSITDVEEYNKIPVDGGKLPAYSEILLRKARLSSIVLNHQSSSILCKTGPIPSSYFGYLMVAALAFSLPFYASSLMRKRQMGWGNLASALCLSPTFFIALVLSSLGFFVIFVPDADGPHHVLPTLPYLKILFAAFVTRIAIDTRKISFPAVRYLLLSSCVLLTLIAFVLLFRNYIYVKKYVYPRASGHFTPYITSLIERTEQWGNKRLVFIHWGIDKQIYLFARHHPKGRLLFHDNQESVRQFLNDEVKANTDSYLFIGYATDNLAIYTAKEKSAHRKMVVRGWNKFAKITTEVGAVPVLYDSVTDERGKNVFEIFQLKWAPGEG